MRFTVRELVVFGLFPYSQSRLSREDNNFIDRAMINLDITHLQSTILTNYLVGSDKWPLLLW